MKKAVTDYQSALKANEGEGANEETANAVKAAGDALLSLCSTIPTDELPE